MKVYVLERDVYSSRYISGVFSSLEAAMASAPGSFATDVFGVWDNDRDGGYAASIFECEVREAPLD